MEGKIRPMIDAEGVLCVKSQAIDFLDELVCLFGARQLYEGKSGERNDEVSKRKADTGR